MEQLEERVHERNGETFAFRLYRTGSGFSVAAFLDGQQISPTYSVSFETHADYFMQHKQSVTENLFEIARSDIDRQMYFRA